MIFLFSMLFFPFHLGRVMLYLRSWILSSATNPVLSTVVPLTEQVCLANITLKNALSVTNLTSDYSPNASVFGHIADILETIATEVMESSKNLTTTPRETIWASLMSNSTTLAVGYTYIFSLVVIYFGTVEVIRYIKGEPLITGSVCKQFMTAMKHLATMIKVVLLLVIVLGLLPLMYGWLLDISTVMMFGKTIAQRVDFFFTSPVASSLIHWAVGIVYMLQISVFVTLLKRVLRNGVLSFLRDPADPNHNPLIDDPLHKHAYRVLLSVAVYGSSIAILVFLPVKLALQMAPSIFPLNISLSDPFTEFPAKVLLCQICIPFAIKDFRLRATIKSLLHYWFAAVGWALGLTDFLLPRPRVNVGQQNRNQDPVRHQRSDSERSGFVISIVLLLLAACMTLLILNSVLIMVPISIGRSLSKAVPFFPITHGMKCNDLYAFIIGSYVISTMLAYSRIFIDEIRKERATVFLDQFWKWCTCFVTSSLFLSILIFVIPVLIGLVFDLLIIVPIRVSVDESPVILLYQDWAFGIIILKIWTQLVDDRWCVKLERVRRSGFLRLQGVWVLQEIIIPIVMKLLTVLCVPYVLARGVFRVFAYPLIVNSAILGVCLALLCAKGLCVWYANLHNSIRDDRYLIGRRVHNLGKV
ncbi:probable E3 ubiquitin ligase SUD1 [Rutidosis leptorrhynchoides]|uniref:probable E3 ubiquitin ligase SUD1 n=1 Tax=Rutidosis leptorrhynchoides TaxID=125765 RepID=UPI003A9A4C24